MPRWLQTIHNTTRSYSLSARLTGKTGDSFAKPIPILRWALESERNVANQYFAVNEFLVDYGPLNMIAKSSFLAKSPETITSQEKQLWRKIVILGDLRAGGRDVVVVPGQRDVVPAVLVFACEAYTLSGHPLYWLTWKGCIALDFLLAVTICGGMSFLGTVLCKLDRVWLIKMFQIAFILVMVTIVVIAGIAFVSTTRVMWDDVFVVAGLLMIYGGFESGILSKKSLVPRNPS